MPGSGEDGDALSTLASYSQAGVTGVVQSSALGQASAMMKSGALTVFDAQLSKLYLEGQSNRSGGALALEALTPMAADAVQMIGGQGFVTVDITARDGDGSSQLPALVGAGLKDASTFRGVVSGLISLGDLGHLRTLLAGAADGKADDIGFARLSDMSTFAGPILEDRGCGRQVAAGDVIRHVRRSGGIGVETVRQNADRDARAGHAVVGPSGVGM